MPLMPLAQGRLQPVDGAFGVELPPRFAGVQAGCFPQLYAALAPNPPDFAITL